MPEEADLSKLARDIQKGVDGIEVPEVFIVESEEEAPEEIRRGRQWEIGNMKSGDRLKLALRGNREARTILIRDTSLMIRRYVLLNPRVTDDEILMVVRNRQVDKELLEVVVRNKEWMNNYQVKLAVVKNPKTPMTISMKYISTLMVRDLRMMAKSKNIPTAVNSAAKRIILRGSLR